MTRDEIYLHYQSLSKQQSYDTMLDEIIEAADIHPLLALTVRDICHQHHDIATIGRAWTTLKTQAHLNFEDSLAKYECHMALMTLTGLNMETGKPLDE